jgi:hypothetical protein
MKFWKITNDLENHHGMQYHDGLNEDILEFNPHGNCRPGGIYFASKDILAFLSYGPWIREVTLPESEEVYTNPGTPVKYKAHRVILGERKKWNDPEVFKDLLKEEGVDPSDRDNLAIRWAAENGHLEVVKVLLEDKRIDPSARDNYAIRCAAENGHLKVVKLLLKDKRVDPSASDNYAICWAAEKGHLEFVKLLLKDKRVDPGDRDNFAIRWASRNGHLEVVELLKKDPRVSEKM